MVEQCSSFPSDPLRRPRGLTLTWRSGLMAGVLLMMLGLGALQPVPAQSLADAVPLRCRLAEGPWRDCQMWVEQIGSLWSLVVGEERIGFRHDGRGSVLMQRSDGPWRPVQARWNAEAVLCWDGVCAQGNLPLD